MASQISMETLNAKIGEAEQNVARTKKAYEAATEELKKLMDKRDAVKRDEIVNAIIKSRKSYDEIMDFLADESQKAE